MPSPRFLLALILVLLGGCRAAPPVFTQTQRDSLATEVRQAVGQLTEAMNAHDPTRVLSFYRDTEDFVYLGCTDLMFGSAFFKGIVGPYYINNPEVTFRREILRVQVLGPSSAVVTLQGGSTETEALFWTQVLTREDDGRWLISHEHASWPGCKVPPPLHPTGRPGGSGVGS